MYKDIQKISAAFLVQMTGCFTDKALFLSVIQIGIKPLSLCMRLFGNVLGAFVIMKLIECILPVGLPVIFSAYFDVFDGLIQAYVFVFLTGLFIKEAIE